MTSRFWDCQKITIINCTVHAWATGCNVQVILIRFTARQFEYFTVFCHGRHKPWHFEYDSFNELIMLRLYKRKNLIRFRLALCGKNNLLHFFARYLKDWLLVYLSRSYSNWYHLRIFWMSKLMPLCFLVGGKSWRLKSLRK